MLCPLSSHLFFLPDSELRAQFCSRTSFFLVKSGTEVRIDNNFLIFNQQYSIKLRVWSILYFGLFCCCFGKNSRGKVKIPGVVAFQQTVMFFYRKIIVMSQRLGFGYHF